MPMLNHAGRFIAQPAEWTVEEGGQNKLPTFVCRFNCVYQFNSETGEWDDIRHDDSSITGYFYLFKKDGNENTRTIDDIKAAIGWDGRSFASLVGGAWGEVECQITTEFEEYNGKTKLKLKWLNPRDYVHNGGLEQASPQLVQSLDARYGAKLRASAGPCAPAKTAAPAGVPANVDAAKRAAWNQFLEAWGKHVANVPADAQNRDVQWKALVGGAFGNRVATGAVSVNEWKAFGDRIKAYGVFPPSPDVPPDDAPGSDGPPPGIHKENKAARQAARQPAMAGPAPEDDPSHPDFLPV